MGTAAVTANNGLRSAGQTTLKDRVIQQRLQDRQRELRIREREDERIALIQEEMAFIQSSDMDFELKKSKLSSLTNRIKNIYEARQDREALDAEREMMRTKALLEESERAEKPPNSDDSQKKPEEIEEAKQRDSIMGMSLIASKQDRLNILQRTRAALKAEAGHLGRAMGSPNSNYVKIGAAPGEDLVIASQSGYGNPGDFRTSQLEKLNLGISKTTAAINHTIASMYKESSNLQESQLAEHKKHADDEKESETIEINEEL